MKPALIFVLCLAAVLLGQIAPPGPPLTKAPGSLLAYSAGAVGIQNSVAQYFAAGGSLTSTVETDVQMPIAVAGTISKLFLRMSLAPGISNQTNVYVNKNGSGTAVGCVISDSAVTCNDSTHSFSVAAGDLVDVEVVMQGNAGASTVVFTAQFAPS